jgi:hypothetical protein
VQKKIEANLREFDKKSDPDTRLTPKAAFLKKLNAEKDPEKRKLLLKVLRGRMFQ